MIDDLDPAAAGSGGLPSAGVGEPRPTASPSGLAAGHGSLDGVIVDPVRWLRLILRPARTAHRAPRSDKRSPLGTPSRTRASTRRIKSLQISQSRFVTLQLGKDLYHQASAGENVDDSAAFLKNTEGAVDWLIGRHRVGPRDQISSR
jgi:hypothetical protein